MYIVQFPKTKPLDYLKQVLLTDVFENFMLCNVLQFCSKEKHDISVIDDCSPWCNIVCDFYVGIGEKEGNFI